MEAMKMMRLFVIMTVFVMAVSAVSAMDAPAPSPVFDGTMVFVPITIAVLSAIACALCSNDSYKVPTDTYPDDTTTRRDVEKSGRTVTFTTEDMQKKKNDVKARTTLLLSLLDEHQLRNDLDTISLDDLYNHLKNTNNEDGNTAGTAFPTGSVNVVTISQDTASAYIASQSNGSQIKFKDINQIDEDDMEEMDIKWNMALAPKSQERGRKESYRQGSKAEVKSSKALMAIDGVGWDWSYMANEEDRALVADGEAPTEFTLMANTESKRSDQVKEGAGYNDVPPPGADLYLSPKKDLSWTGLP
nr:transmembrane protein [Tanacetum cinerariifolium]